MEASEAPITWLALLCRSLVFVAIDSKDRRDERAPNKGHKGYGPVQQPLVPVSRRSVMCLTI